ncbi:MAG: hypothetical protein IJF53_01230 [Clostridia bacterium]|nr:hypothetical protein [Clostridia bacterium]
MKLKSRKLLALICCTSLMLSAVSIPAYAQESDNILTPDELVADFSSVYNNDPNIIMEDVNGNDITLTFVEETKNWYENKEYEKVYDFFVDNVYRMTENDSPLTRSGIDLSKTVTEKVTIFCEWTGEMDPEYDLVMNRDNDGYVSYYVRCTITYNPNTYVITSIGTPLRVTGLTMVGEWADNLTPAIGDENYTKGPLGGVSTYVRYWVEIVAWYNIAGANLSMLTYDVPNYSTITIEAG